MILLKAKWSFRVAWRILRNMSTCIQPYDGVFWHDFAQHDCVTSANGSNDWNKQRMAFEAITTSEVVGL